MGKTILHADDSPSVRQWVAEHLNGLGVNVVSVGDGDVALRVLMESPCDLLLTDLEMPRLDGLALAAVVRELPQYRFLPVLIFSSRHPAEIESARRQGAGVTGWITKPIEPEDLRRWVRRLLPR